MAGFVTTTKFPLLSTGIATFTAMLLLLLPADLLRDRERLALSTKPLKVSAVRFAKFAYNMLHDQPHRQWNKRKQSVPCPNIVREEPAHGGHCFDETYC